MSEVFWAAWATIAIFTAVFSAVGVGINVEEYRFDDSESAKIAAIVCGVIALASVIAIPFLLELAARAGQP